MSAKEIENALGLLQDDPNDERAWATLKAALIEGAASSDASAGGAAERAAEIAAFAAFAAGALAEARRAFAGWGEYQAVARLLDVEAELSQGKPNEAAVLAELARVYDEDLLADDRAVATAKRVLLLDPENAKATSIVEESAAKRGRWADLVSRYVDEAKTGEGLTFRSALLTSAAETAFRFGRPELAAKEPRQLTELMAQVEGGLREAISVDPRNARARHLLERALRATKRWDDLAALLESQAEMAANKDDRKAGYVRVARLFAQKQRAPSLSATFYKKAIEVAGGDANLLSAQVGLLARFERWDDLAALYDEGLAVDGKTPSSKAESQIGGLLLAASSSWKRRGADAAEALFERARKLDPTRAEVLSFFREQAAAKGDSARLLAVLTEAQRAAPDGASRAAFSAELARLAEESANPAKAVEQWRALLRQEPENAEARQALRRLYRSTAAWNALTDLLRQELDRLPADAKADRLSVLREIAEVYREHVKSDSAIATVLAQVVALDPTDVGSVRELARAYEGLGRWRDLLATQARLAELTPDASQRAELHRAVARRWLDQFSNAQNAAEAYEKLAALAPDDHEAMQKLRELYAKRRAFRPLYELLERHSERLPAGSARREVWGEMARLAAERLERGAEAAALYRKILDEDPEATTALDALEKQAERDKDWKTVAEVLERRVTATADVTQKLALLQKLGGLYADRLLDVPSAQRAWRRVLSIAPGQPKALRILRDSYLSAGDYEGLTELFTSTSDIEGLAEVLGAAAERAPDPQTKIDLSYRAADVYVERLGMPDRAFRAYERVLSARPDDLRAALALAPLYESEEKWTRLPALYEVLLGHAKTDPEKLALLDKLADVTGRRLGDRGTSLRYARRAYELAAASDNEREPHLARFEAGVEEASAWSELVEALEARLPSAPDAEKRELRAKIASVKAREGDLDAAVAGYKALAFEDPSDEAPLRALDELLRGKERSEDLRWLFETRIGRANTAHKLELLVEWALLEEEALEAPEHAVPIYRRILEIVPQHGGALRALARLLQAQGDLPGALEALERDRDQRSGAERNAREVEIAGLYLQQRKALEALAAAKRALTAGQPDSKAHELRAVLVIEELLSVGETRAQAAVLLDEHYGASGAFIRQAEVIEVRIATAASKGDRLSLYERLAAIHERLGKLETAFDVVTRSAREFPGELPVWDRLASLAQRTKRSQQLVAALAEAVPPAGDSGLPAPVEADLAERTATLYQEMLGDPDRARPYWERLWVANPHNERAFARLKQNLTAGERWAELEQLYERGVSAAEEPARKITLLGELAIIGEEMMGDANKAAHAHERILAIDPDHERSTRALDALYTREERWPELVNLLERRLPRVPEGDARPLELRLGVLIFSRLGDPPRALSYLERVLAAEPTNKAAREVLEKTLDVPGLRPRGAVVLERAYGRPGDQADLVRVLEVRLEAELSPDDRRSTLRQVAELRQHLNDERGALEAYARYLPLSPDDDEARASLLATAARLGAEERATGVLLLTADAADAKEQKAAILADVARVYENALASPERAEGIHQRVLALDPENAELALPAARALERIYVAHGKNVELAEVLRLQVKLEASAAARSTLLARLGELSENVLTDPAAAIDAFRARLELEPGDPRALVALDRLYERTGDHRALVEVLRQREEAAESPEARRELMLRAARTLAGPLSDRQGALAIYRQVADDFGPERDTLAALASLYEAEARWPELSETLQESLPLAESSEERLALLARLGEVRLRRTEDVAGALDVYRQALALEPLHAPSRVALEELLAHPTARLEAAQVLRPLYEDGAEHAHLLRVLDIEIEHEEALTPKLTLVERALRVAETQLHEPSRAWDYAVQGVRLSAESERLPQWLAEAERLADVTAAHAALVTLLADIIPEILDGGLQLEVTLKVASLAKNRLANPTQAREYYAKALDQKSDERRALEALEVLYDEASDAPSLLGILKRRAEVAVSEEERKVVLYKQARLSRDALHDPRGAIETYEQILGVALEDPAILALEKLYTEGERWDDLIALYERVIAAPETKATRSAALHFELAKVQQTHLSNYDLAFTEYAAALEVDPQHEGTIQALEALMGERAQPSRAAQAAEMLETVYLARHDWMRVMKTLEARLEVSDEPSERRVLLGRIAKLHEEQEENYGAALETTAKLLSLDIADETTWAELERLARVANAKGRLAEIYAAALAEVKEDEAASAKLAKRTGELFEEQGERERSLAFFRRAHEFAPDADPAVFAAIDRLLASLARPAERVTLYREALDYQEHASARLSTLHTIAFIEEQDLASDDLAIETYRGALDIDETDARTLEALARLYTRRERFRDLADLTRRRAEHAPLPEDEARYRLDLGRLLETKLGEVLPAIDEYQIVTELSPPPGASGAAAVSSLEALLRAGGNASRLVDILRPLYERADDWRKLLELNEHRLGFTEDAAERIALLRENAHLLEARGKDAGAAFRALEEAFVLDPDDGVTRAELDRLAEVGRRWDALANTYERAIQHIEGPGQRELLGALARLHDLRRDDPRRALEAWGRLAKQDETDVQPLEEMDALATLLSDWPTLVAVLAKKAELLTNDAERASTWRRVGEARRDMLDDAGGAVEAYEHALEADPDSAFTLDNLIALYEERDNAARLVELYRRRIDLADDQEADLKYRLLLAAASRYESVLLEPRAAIDALNEALLVKPGDVEALRQLDPLYTREQLWPELLDVLRQQAKAAPDEGTRRFLKKRVGALLAGELDEPQQALDAYREVLASDYDADAAGAVRALSTKHEELRLPVAEVLEPVLRSAGRFGDLADVLEMRLNAEEQTGARVSTLRTIAEISESRLGDPGRALEALLRALTEEPGDDRLHAEVERLATQIGEDGFRRYADVLTERAAALFDGTVTTALYTRLGKVAEERLADPARAARAFAHATEQGGDQPALLSELDRLYEALGEAPALADVLERRIALESDPLAQAGLLQRLAGLQRTKLDDRARALSTLRQALEIAPRHEASVRDVQSFLEDGPLFEEAFEALETAYRRESQGEALASLYERKVSRAGGVEERARARMALSTVLEDEVRDPARAQRVLEDALVEAPANGEVASEIERLAPSTEGGWRHASVALNRALSAEGVDLDASTRAELWVRLAGWRRDHLADLRGAEEALFRALSAEPEDLAVLQAVEALQRVPGRERDLVATLRSRARLEAEGATRSGLLREAKELAEEKLHDAPLALELLRGMIEEDDTDVWALAELTKLRRADGDAIELVALLKRRAELVSDQDAKELLHEAARITADELHDSAGAIALYEDLFERDPDDETAASSLRRLYAEAGRERDLAKLISLLIDSARTVDERSRLRLELATLQAERFAAPREAVDTLRAVLEEDPRQRQALFALADLLATTGDDEDLADLLTDQIERARDAGDAAFELSLMVRLGDVFEQRLKDTPRALATYEAVLAREPAHRAALEAVARLAEARGAWERAAFALETLLALPADGETVERALRLAYAKEQLHDADGVRAALERALLVDGSNTDVRARLRDLYERARSWDDLAKLLVGDADLIASAHATEDRMTPLVTPTRQPSIAPEREPSARPSLPPRNSLAPQWTLPPPPSTGPAAEQVKLLRRAAEIHLKERHAPEDAVSLLERATRLTPTDRELMLMLCDAYAAAHRDRDAAGVLERIIASFGNRRTKELSVYHHRLGRALSALGDKDVALAQFDMAFKIDPGSVTVLKDLGVLALETGDLDRAQKTFRALLLQRLEPSAGISKAEVFFYLGEVSARQGDKPKAIQMLERALENEVDMPQARARLLELKA